MASNTIVGLSGRQYVRGQLLHRKGSGRGAVFKATRGDDSAPVILKYESESIYELSQRLGAEFANSRWLRMPIDYSPDEHVVIYPYPRDTMLSLVQADPNFPSGERKKALRYVGEGLREFHAQGWIHLDVHPNNVFIDWTTCADGKKMITSAALSDFSVCLKQEGDTPLQTLCTGSFMWRSPEGQTGTGITQATDVFSFGLLCIYAFGGKDFLLIGDDQGVAELAAQGPMPEQEILCRHFMYFGPATQGLLQQVDEKWRDTLAKISDEAVDAVQENPVLSFKVWGRALGPEAVYILSKMTNPDPTARPTMDEVMSHSWWQEP